jgi:hypothetical protein
MIEAAASELDPDWRVLVMLSARPPKLGHGAAATPFGFRPLVQRGHKRGSASESGVRLRRYVG